MDDEQRARSVIRTLEAAHADTLEELAQQGDRRRDALKRWQKQTDRRYWIVTVLLTAAIATTVASVVGGALLLSAQNQRLEGVVAQQQSSRERAAVDACEERNRIAGGILYFIRRVAPDLGGNAASVFRIQASCERYTAAVLADREPPPTVPGHPVPPVP